MVRLYESIECIMAAGQGSMYNSEDSIPLDASPSKIITQTAMEPTVGYSQTTSDPIVDRFMSKLMLQAEEIGRLKARVEQLERELEEANTPPDAADVLQTVPPKVLKGA